MFADLHYAFRRLLKHPGFTVIAAVTLALGIGTNTAIYSAVHGILVSALPYGNADRLVMVWEDLTDQHNPRFSVAPANYRDVRTGGAAVFSDVAAQLGHGFTLTGIGGPAEAVRGAQVTTNYFDVLSVHAAVGRTLVADDTSSNAADVAVISWGLWQRRFAGDSSAVGRTVFLDGSPYQLVGVLTKDFRAPSFFKAPQLEAAIWTPLALPQSWDNREVAVLQLVARLRGGVTPGRAKAAMSGLAERLATVYPETNADVGFNVVTLREQLVGGARSLLLILFAAGGLVLLVACANLASVSLTRTLSRRRELAICAAVGAPHRRLVRAMLLEHLAVAALGGMLGVVVGWWGTTLLVALAPADTPRLQSVALNGPVLAFSIAVTLVTGLAIGLLPAVRGARTDVHATLKDAGEGRRIAGGRSTRWRDALAVVQIAVALAMLVGGGLLVRSFVRLEAVDPGFDADGVLTFRMGLPAAEFATPDSRRAFFREMFARLEASPGVRFAGGTTRFPLDPAYGWGALDIEGRPVAEGTQPLVGLRTVTRDYFRALRIPVAAGRGFTDLDRTDSRPVALVNETMARRFWPGEDPIGRRIGFGNAPDTWYDIVGVVGAVSHDGLDAAPIPEAYLAFTQDPLDALDVVVRGTGHPMGLVGTVREVVQSISPDVPLIDVRPMSALVDSSVAPRRFIMILLAAFAVAAAGLAVLGIYGVVAFVVRERRSEIGIRIALGEGSRRTLQLVFSRALRLLAIGLVLGTLCALMSSRLLASQLFRVAPVDPPTYIAASALVLIATLAATWFPARRAMQVDPMEALRNE